MHYRVPRKSSDHFDEYQLTLTIQTKTIPISFLWIVFFLFCLVNLYASLPNIVIKSSYKIKLINNTIFL